jgi:hypothetical protein
VRTFSTASRAPAAPAADGLGPLRARKLWATSAPGRRGSPPSLAELLACCGRGAAALPRPSGREPYGRGGCRAPLASDPPRSVPRPRAGSRNCKSGSAVPSRRASCHRAKITVKGPACGASFGWRERHPLSSDLPRRTSAPIEGTGKYELTLRLRPSSIVQALNRGNARSTETGWRIGSRPRSSSARTGTYKEDGEEPAADETKLSSTWSAVRYSSHT